ncbi:MAG: peroxiredoxin [Holophaga sp.]|nr:peroxiredoxin [Holophaga sp.]
MLIQRGLLAGLLSVVGFAQAGEKPVAVVEGAKAPYFEAVDQNGKLVRLSDFAGKANIVLYFYPKDDTPGCTAQACSLRDGFGAIQASGAVILGVSADTKDSHKAFAQKFSLPFSLLADPERTVIDSFGVKMPVVGMAKRVTFIIDKQGVIRRILRQVDTKQHDQQVLEILKTLV